MKISQISQKKKKTHTQMSEHVRTPPGPRGLHFNLNPISIDYWTIRLIYHYMGGTKKKQQKKKQHNAQYQG